MKIEIVEFYPLIDKPRKLHGSMHIYLIDYQMDIRGVHVKTNGDSWWFRLPYRVGYDPETKKEITYPIVTFTDNEKNKLLIKAIITQGKEYIIKNFIKNDQLVKK